MTTEKAQSKINNIDKILDKVEKVEGDELKLLEEITEWLSEHDGGVVITDEEEGESHEETEEEVEEVVEKKKRGRPAKPKEAEEKKVDERYLINGATPRFYESEPPKKVPLTRELAEKFKSMKKFPRDRELQKARMEFLRGIVKNKEFYGAEWVIGKCEENGEEYRMNGKHTSEVCCEFYENGQVIEDVYIIVREFTCPTMVDVAALFNTFDTKQSARTKQDSLRAFASAMEETSELPDWMIVLLNAGLSFAKKKGRGYRSMKVDEQATLLLAQPKFASWLSDFLNPTETSVEDKKIIRKNIGRVPVVGAIYTTFDKDAEAAEEFWTKIRDDCDDPKDSPPRRLRNWLQNHKLGGRSTGEGASEHEFFTVCLKAWNAFRGKKKTQLNYDKDKDKETLEVV